ncbi:hypothetical protein FAZ19_19280 [Sphingobacterium alkalisoli]|uniref:Uncharacterized protein n=1 Tax=Sphingobacterium alkalisoli TaxID=1874115 RepID=A0A4U0GUG6_9SPHI|nr:hypothetical protein [Sphingobacterium alkalisoli]TJY62617.1 hypothetical protein FAZ19_19280 [Sphingobacterium alkalisoli]GGH27805.1 hypothetical protein GCM10011418_37980 [Sphingobacterium alkalisoli]
METHFEISLNMKTLKGLETYASFYLGTDQLFATRLFNMMQGEREIMKNAIITVDLTKKEDGIPFTLAALYCNCEHLAYNIKIITKEIFKKLNLEENKLL